MSTQGNTTWPRRKPVSAVPEKKKTSKKKILMIVGLLLAILLVGAGSVWAFNRMSANAKASAMIAKMDDPNADRRTMFRDMRDLPDSAKQQVREAMEERRMQHVRDVMAMPHDQMIAEINKEIDRMVERQKDAEKRRAERGGKGGPGGPNGQNPNGASNGQNGNSSGDQANNQQPGGRGYRTDETRQANRDKWLSSRPATDRVAMTQYREVMKAQMLSRGVSGGGMGGFGR